MNMETSYWRSFFMPCTGYFYQKRHNDSKSVCPSNSIPDIPIPSPDLYPSELALLNLHEFTFAEMNSVTNYKSSRNFLGEGGFGPVYKGFLPDKLRPGLEEQHVAVKYLDQEGNQGHKEWMAEVRCLGQYRHPNLVKLIGYCCEKQHRMLVYEYMPGGSLENLLFMKSLIEPFSWLQRLKIAVEAAKGLAFLHDAEKPLIYRDFKASNILLDSDYTAKLSDFGLAKDGPQGDEYISTRPMGTHGYAAPDYLMTGHLTAKSDVYSFGVVLLELLTGRRCLDESRCARERNLVDWARPYLKRPDRFHKIMDPNLQGNYFTEAAQKPALVAYLCLSNKSKPRPRMKEVVDVLEPLLQIKEFPMGTFIFIVPEVDENCGKMKSVDENLVTGEDHERRERRDHRRRRIRHVHSVVHAEGGLQREAKDLSEDSLRRQFSL